MADNDHPDIGKRALLENMAKKMCWMQTVYEILQCQQGFC